MPRTLDEKREWYRKGWYSMPAPPVCTQYWNENAWITYISQNGMWVKVSGE